MKQLTCLLAVLLLSFSINAQQPEIFSTNGKAIRGYDPVAFFNQSAPVKGADSLSYTWKNTEWLFSNRQNLESFKKDPEKFAPQYGGYCAYGVSDDHKSPTQTDTWTIVNDKLYFNYNTKVKEHWSKNREQLIEQADKKWPEVKKM